MRGLHTAILHLHRSGRPPEREALQVVLGPLQGVREVEVEAREQVVMVRFDEELTGLADIVRSIEDEGSTVSSVAQRPALDVLPSAEAVPREADAIL